MKTLITAFLFYPVIPENLLPGNMKRSKFSDQKTHLELGVQESLITKYCASDNREQQEAASLANEPSIKTMHEFTSTGSI